MALTELYEQHEVEDRLKCGKPVLFICSQKDYDLTRVVSEFLLDKTQYEITYPKSDDKSVAYDILMQEIAASRAKLAIQIDCNLTRKLPWWRDGETSPGLLEKVAEVRGDIFINLHHHDEFSIRDGLGRVDDLLALLESRNQTICAVTNHGAVGGWIKQYKQCREARIKPIFGMEAYVNDYRGDDPEERKKHRSNFHLLLLAKNFEGFYNIVRLHNDAQLNGFYYMPRCNYENLKKYGKGVIGSSACYAGEIAQALAEDDFLAAKVAYDRYTEAFDEFYIELVMIEWDEQVAINHKLIQFAQKVGAPLIVTLDSHYLYPEFADTHDLLMLIRTGKTILDKVEKPEEVWQFDVRNLYYRTEVELRQLWKEKYKSPVFTEEVLNEAILNTRRIAIGTENIELDSSFKLPRLYKDSNNELCRRARAGLRKRGLDSIPKYEERLEFELKVITELGYADYFLVVDKVVGDTKKKFGEWSVGWGRGSAGGSLVSYCLSITDLDPIQYGLLFERFLDYGRKDDCPDIDLDFQKRVRDWVKQHVVDTFGEKHTCSIGTYSTYKTASVIIDVARALGLDVWEAMGVTKKIDALASFQVGEGDDSHQERVDQMEFDELFKHYPDLEAYFRKYPEVYQHAMILRNQVKNMGKHAGGMIISNLDIQNQVPVYRDKSDQIVSAWTEGLATHELSAVGLVKYDFLGLNNLDIIQDAVDYIEQRRGKRLGKRDVDIDEKEAIQISSKHDLVGIFQFENPATKPIADAVKMESIFDISAVTALIRPGPRDMGMDREYAERKHKRKRYTVPVCLREALEETHGIIVYQEQVQKIAQALSGFDAIDANRLRKALIKGKGDAKALDVLHEKFLEGAQQRIQAGEVTQREVEDWWQLCKAFAEYGFNRCLTLDCVVETPDGMRLFGDIAVGDKVKAPDGESGCKFVEVVDVMDSEEEVWEVTLESGKTISSSMNHKYLCEDGVKRRLEEVLEGDHKVICEDE